MPGAKGGADTTPAELDEICATAERSATELEGLGREGRAVMLEAMAGALEMRRDELVAAADAETALGPVRLASELTRTGYQLRLFAEVLRDGAYLEAVIDHAGPTPMGPRPDLRRMLRPLGPVAVFGASNFPFAFSVPGGDSASALAAGCPVVAKMHPLHPETSSLCREALVEGALAAGLATEPVGLVSGQQPGAELVAHRSIKAVGFTGSLQTGMILSRIAAQRSVPIPFYGELGALNAVVVCPEAAASRAEEIAAGLVASFTLGVGQFCTKPGLVLVPGGTRGRALLEALATRASEVRPARMLGEPIAARFVARAAEIAASPGVSMLAQGDRSRDPTSRDGLASLVYAEPGALRGVLLEECFGPLLVASTYADRAELVELVEELSPALTATLHADRGDDELASALVGLLSSKVGRIVWNGFPTGVAVSWAMHHGGSFPATTNPAHTSVGASAIRRFLAPVCYQDVPEELLPAELREEATAQIPRRVDGRLVCPPERPIA